MKEEAVTAMGTEDKCDKCGHKKSKSQCKCHDKKENISGVILGDKETTFESKLKSALGI